MHILEHTHNKYVISICWLKLFISFNFFDERKLTLEADEYGTDPLPKANLCVKRKINSVCKADNKR